MKTIKFKLSYCLLVLIIVLTGCTNNFKYKVDKNKNSVTIHQDSTLIQIEVIDHAIIHVQKQLLGQEVSDLPDYVTVLEPQNVDWKLKETKNYVSISTDKLEVKFKSDGTLEYSNLDGDNLVTETNELSYIKPDTSNENTLSQAFI
jgi:alpha-D-xyloside xylohydrolase